MKYNKNMRLNDKFPSQKSPHDDKEERKETSPNLFCTAKKLHYPGTNT